MACNGLLFFVVVYDLGGGVEGENHFGEVAGERSVLVGDRDWIFGWLKTITIGVCTNLTEHVAVPKAVIKTFI